ncbi:hypothetical protein [Amycolatopsis sp. CA-126428]|uniref:hypothetical protein n=1 Tax=Amycolatopsis sp. CA-126428 TaxID=2073158 RepID=UPI000CD239AF|nr:hypothetical protein [Amycolatopsis sp. CA-126428]
MSTTPFVVPDGEPGDAYPRHLAEALHDGEYRAGRPALVAAVEHVRANEHLFTAWLREMSADRIAVAELLERSYWHPNGFAKIVLGSIAEFGFRIRLHIWPRSDTPSRGESNPHSHRWEFASYVLAGTGMHMAEFAETVEGGRSYRRYRYGADPANPAALVADGEVRLRRRIVTHVSGGDLYTCGTSIVHAVRPIDGELTATVVVEGPRRTPHTVVYCEPGEGSDQPNLDLAEADFDELLNGLLATLGGEAAP